MRTRWLALGLSVLALGLVAGCGDDDEDEGGGGAAATTEEPAPEPADTAGGGATDALQLSAPQDGSLTFNTTELTTTAGEVVIDFDNPSSVPHNVTIEGEDAATETFTEGSETLSTMLTAGTYTFFCSVPGHRQGGMEGTLEVTAG